jgi:hypothetical protein
MDSASLYPVPDGLPTDCNWSNQLKKKMNDYGLEISFPLLQLYTVFLFLTRDKIPNEIKTNLDVCFKNTDGQYLPLILMTDSQYEELFGTPMLSHRWKDLINAIVVVSMIENTQ